MNLTQKVLLSLLLASVIFTGFAVTAYSRLFDIIDQRYYNERVREANRALLLEVEAATERYVRDIRTDLAALASEDALRSAFAINQGRDDIDRRAELVNRFVLTYPETDYIRIVDSSQGQLWFSTLESDVLDRTATRIEFVPPSDLEPPLVRPEQDDGPVGWDADAGAFTVAQPVSDSFGAPRGSIVARFALTGLFQRLVAEGLIGPSSRVRMTPGGVLVFNARRVFSTDDLAAIDVGLALDERAPIISSDIGEAYLLERSEGSEIVPPGVFLVRESDLSMDRSLRIILLAATFVVTFLVAYLLLNLRQDPSVVVEERFRRFQRVIVRDYLAEGANIDAETWKRELDRRRNRIEGEVRRGLGRLRGRRKAEFEATLSRNWTELYRLMGGGGAQPGARAELEPVSLRQIEEIIERTLARHGGPAAGAPRSAAAAPPRPQPAAAAAEASPYAGMRPVEVEDVDEDDELEELTDADEVAEVEELDELEELEEPAAAEASPYAGMRPVEVEDVDEDDELEELSDADEVAEVEELDEVEELEEPSAAEASPYAGMRPVEVEDVDEDEELEELTDADEVAEAAEVEELDEVEELEEPSATDASPYAGMRPVEVEDVDEDEDLEELTDADEVAEAAEVEELDELDELEELAEPAAAEASPYAGMRPVEVEEVDEDDELEELSDTEDVAEVAEAAEVEELDELDELEDPAAADVIADAAAVDEIDELDELETDADAIDLAHDAFVGEIIVDDGHVDLIPEETWLATRASADEAELLEVDVVGDDEPPVLTAEIDTPVDDASHLLRADLDPSASDESSAVGTTESSGDDAPHPTGEDRAPIGPVTELWETRALGPRGEHPELALPAPASPLEGDAVEETDEVDDLEPLEEIEPDDELEPLEETDEADDLEPLEEIEPDDELEPLEETDEVDDLEPLEEIDEVDDLEPLEEIDEADDLEPLEEFEPTTDSEELESLEEFDDEEAPVVSLSDEDAIGGGNVFLRHRDMFVGPSAERAQPLFGTGMRMDVGFLTDDDIETAGTALRGTELSSNLHIAEFEDFARTLGRLMDVIDTSDRLVRILPAAYDVAPREADEAFARLVENVVNRTTSSSIDDIMADAFGDLEFDGAAGGTGTIGEMQISLGGNGITVEGMAEGHEADQRRLYRFLVRLTHSLDARVGAIIDRDAEGGFSATHRIGIPDDCSPALRIRPDSGFSENVAPMHRVALLKGSLASFSDFAHDCAAQRLTALSSWVFLPYAGAGPARRYLVLGFGREHADLIQFGGRTEVSSVFAR